MLARVSSVSSVAASISCCISTMDEFFTRTFA
jgi:hypothetical protein